MYKLLLHAEKPLLGTISTIIVITCRNTPSRNHINYIRPFLGTPKFHPYQTPI